jgi:hypothetical protein
MTSETKRQSKGKTVYCGEPQERENIESSKGEMRADVSLFPEDISKLRRQRIGGIYHAVGGGRISAQLAAGASIWLCIGHNYIIYCHCRPVIR